MPAVKQNRSKLADTSSQALPTAPAFIGGKAVSVVLTLFMALLSFVESAPRAYWLKASNAAPSFSTFPGTIPRLFCQPGFRAVVGKERRLSRHHIQEIL